MRPSRSSLAAATEPERSQSATRSGRPGRRARKPGWMGTPAVDIERRMVRRKSTRPSHAPREPAPQPSAQLADQLACLLDIARGELAEREREEPAGARGAALAARGLSGVPHQG